MFLFKRCGKEYKQNYSLVSKSKFFDRDYYLKKYPDVAAGHLDPVEHFLKFGWKEGRNPSAGFNTVKYLKKYPECNICPLIFDKNRNDRVDLSVCAIMKNEGLYVKEWIDYHRLVGVKRFYIYDNESTDNMHQVLLPYIEKGIVVYKLFRGEAIQIPAYNECVSEYRDNNDWMAFIDTDEFIVPTSKNNIPDFLKDYKDFPGLAINWMMFDSNGHKKKPKGGVLENYVRVNYDDNKGPLFLKCIVQPALVESAHVHRHFYKNSRLAVLENKRKFESGWTHLYHGKKIHINHYYCKSEEEALIKVNRGTSVDPKGVTKPISKTELNFREYKYNYDVYKYLIRLKPQMFLPETIHLVYLKICNAFMFFRYFFRKNKMTDYINSKWYFKHYPEAKASGLSALEHYMVLGWKAGYNPGPDFDTNFYLEKNPDIAKTGANPLRHYVAHGRFEGRIPKPYKYKTLFNNAVKTSKAMDKNYQIVADSNLFNRKWYKNKYLKGENTDPIEHYLTIGWKKGYNPSKKFNTNLYLNAYPDVKKVGRNPLIHYLQNGRKEGRNVFAEASFIKKLFNPYAGKSNEYKLIAKSKLFNKRWYLKQYPEVLESGLDPVSHYLDSGWKQGKNPSRLFDTNVYLYVYNDVKKAGICPLLHYLRAGKKEKRSIYAVGNQKDFSDAVPSKWDKFVCKHKPKDPLISIIVASYNYADIIGRTLDSLVAQTYKNFEVIVVDDGSKDDSVKVIQKYVDKYPFIKLYMHDQGKNMGLPKTVKLGIEKAKGKYIAFCESDDYWSPDHLAEKVNMINNYADPKIIVNDVELFGDKERCEYISIIVNDRKGHFRHTKNRIPVSDFRQKNWIVTFSCCMIKKSVLNKCDITGTPRGANLDWWVYRQVCCANDIFYINKKLTYWYIHDSYMVKEDIESVQKQENFLKTMDKILLKTHPVMCLGLIKHHSAVINSYQVKNGDMYHFNRICKYQPKFSVVMPTYNRRDLITSAIDSLLKQTYKNFELIIVDDGSVDGTQSMVEKVYAKEIDSGIIKYIYKQNSGVCGTRNVGLQNASNEWIAYLDSDNIMASGCLETFAKAILKYKNNMIFYSNLMFIQTKRSISHKFNYEQLLKENYIDLGVFVHHRTIYEKLGGFDENMTRLVDWDLVARYTKDNKPVHINVVTLYYNDSNNYDRITSNANLYDNMVYFRKKNCDYPIVTTMITTYNHQAYIKEAIESAIKQIGNFIHEIIISDDGSTDDTPKIIAEYAEKYPHLIRDISSKKNHGISANMKKCFEAATGKYIAVLEGDDYWTDSQKLEKQMKFLEKNKDCSMVFSRVLVYNEESKKSFLLDRHNNLSDKLIGDDFLKEMSLIVNFSCAMYRTDYLHDLPEVLYEGRLSEIALAMYLEKIGKIGFISTPLSVYRQNTGGVWSGSDRKKQLQQGLISRQTALSVCAPKYKKALQKIIDNQYVLPLKELEESNKGK